MVTGCGKNDNGLKAGWVELDKDRLWENLVSKDKPLFVWNNHGGDIFCGREDFGGGVRLVIICEDCLKKAGYIW